MSNTVLIHIPDWLSNEVSLRMDEKLSIIKIDPANIWQRGPDAGVLLQRYPVASKFVAEKKYLYPPLKKYLYKFLGRSIPQLFVGSPSGVLKFDFIWSNLESPQISPEILVPEWKKHLGSNALLMFSYLGPDTGKNLHRLLGLKEAAPYSSWDMHDVGDALVQEGFAEPVMDMEYVTLDYENLDLLLKDALLLGLIDLEQFNWVSGQDAALAGDGALQITLELVYGHAWTPELNLSKAKDGLATITPDQIVRLKNK